MEVLYQILMDSLRDKCSTDTHKAANSRTSVELTIYRNTEPVQSQSSGRNRESPTERAIGSHSDTARESVQNPLLLLTGLTGLGVQVVYQSLDSLVAVLFLEERGKRGMDRG